MTPEIHASIKNRVCDTIQALGALLDHLQTAAEYARIPGEQPPAEVVGLADLLDDAALCASAAADHAEALAEDTDRLAHAARQLARGLCPALEAEEAP